MNPIIHKNSIFEKILSRVSAKNIGSSVIVPHICNNIGLFGGGFTRGICEHFPSVATNYELLGKKIPLGYVQYISVYKDDLYKHEIIFANMIAQNGVISKTNARPLNYEALVRCMIDVRNYLKKIDKDSIEIHCPKFGSGLAGGNWRFISDLIKDIWPNQTIIIY